MAAAGGGKDETWSGRAAFILAAIGSAVGIGNLVRFPYQAGENGGGAFVIVYMVAVFFIGLPVLMAELYLGRRGGGSPVAAIKRLAASEGASSAWGMMAWIGMLASFLIVTFYSVIAGWLLYFMVYMVGDLFASVGANGLGALFGPAFVGREADDVTGTFGALLASPGTMILYHGIFIAVCTFIVSRGVKGGIEKAATLLMPVFFVLLLVLSLISMTTGNAGEALNFLFAPDLGKLGAQFMNGEILVNAIGQAFFSLSLGSAMMITYGIYLSRDTSIPSSAMTVAAADTSVALIAGLAIFPVVFQFGLPAAGGLGLIFGPLLLAFQQMPLGGLFGIAFFAMGVFAALTSAIALFEVPAATAKGDFDLDDAERSKRRFMGTLLIGGLIFVIGVLHAFSQVPIGSDGSGGNFFNEWKPFGNLPLLGGKTLLDATDTLTGSVMLPLGGFLVSVFAGYAVTQSSSREELGFATEKAYQRWRFLIRYICPFFVGLILVWGAVLAPIIAMLTASS